MVVAGFITFVFGLLFVLMSAVGAGQEAGSTIFHRAGTLAGDAASILSSTMALAGQIIGNIQWVGLFALGVVLTYVGARYMSSTD